MKRFLGKAWSFVLVGYCKNVLSIEVIYVMSRAWRSIERWVRFRFIITSTGHRYLSLMTEVGRRC